MNFKETRKILKTIFIVAIISTLTMAGSTLYGLQTLASSRKITFEDNVSTSRRIKEVVSEVYPALVGMFVKQKEGTAYGSGFLYKIENDKAYIMTNAHVAYGLESPTVYFADKSTTKAELVGKDLNRDIAVVTVPKSVLPQNAKTVSFGDSEKLELAEPVVAIGNPLDPEFFGTTTVGVVSGKSRLWKVDTVADKKAYYQDSIQIDAAVNHGNSGGPLFNLAGQIVGINTQIISVNNGSPVSNFAFSIPSSTITAILSDLEKGQESGIVILGMAPTDSVEFKETRTTDAVERIDGMKIRSVDDNGVVAKAGLQKGDIITKIDDTEVHITRDFYRTLVTRKKDEKAKITYQRDGNKKETTIQFTDVAF